MVEHLICDCGTLYARTPDEIAAGLLGCSQCRPRAAQAGKARTAAIRPATRPMTVAELRDWEARLQAEARELDAEALRLTEAADRQREQEEALNDLRALLREESRLAAARTSDQARERESLQALRDLAEAEHARALAAQQDAAAAQARARQDRERAVRAASRARKAEQVAWRVLLPLVGGLVVVLVLILRVLR